MYHRKPSVHGSVHGSVSGSATDSGNDSDAALTHKAGSIKFQDMEIDDSEPGGAAKYKKTLWAWIILTFAIGPTHSMHREYLAATIQALANAVGHIPGTDKPCVKKGAIQCVVQFGGSEIDYNSYSLYVKSISRALEGLASMLVSGLADYSNNRKLLMVGCTYLMGILALPAAGLVGNDYDHLYILTTISILMSVVSGVGHVIKHSYLPVFMKAREQEQNQSSDMSDGKSSWARGTKVSVFAQVAGQVGALLALLIGIIIVYSRENIVKSKYDNYLLAITVAGCVTVSFTVAGHILLPSIPGAKPPAGQNVLMLPIRIWIKTMGSIRRYPNAFKLCFAWVLWGSALSGFHQLIKALFLETTGLSSGSSIYTVYTFMTVIFSIMGAVGWLYLSKRVNIRTAYFIFFGINIFCVFWGCLGIDDVVPFGYKHQAEFWISDILMETTSHALRAMNPVILAMFIPKGTAGAFFGLENTMDLVTGWIGPLVQGAIQNATHNLRYAMIQNLVLFLLGLGAFAWCDFEQGVRDAERPMN